MSNNSDLPEVIPPSVPDRNIPTEKVEMQSAHKRKQQKSELFLKGPIPLSWIRQYVQCPADRLLLVIRAHADMRRTKEFKLTNGIYMDAGIEARKVRYRALNRLEMCGSLKVDRESGRRPVVRLNA